MSRCSCFVGVLCSRSCCEFVFGVCVCVGVCVLVLVCVCVCVCGVCVCRCSCSGSVLLVWFLFVEGVLVLVCVGV